MEQIEGLSISLGLDSSGMTRSLKSLKERLKDVSSEMTANMSVFDRNERSIQKYETRLNGLNRKLDLQREATSAAREEHARMVQQHGEGSRQAQRAARAYNNEIAALNNLERFVGDVRREFREFREEQEQANSVFGRLSDTLRNTGESLTNFGDKLKGIGSQLTTSITAPIAGLGLAAGAIAVQFDNSAVKIQNSLGLTAKEAKNLTNVSRDIFKDGFGESIEEIDNALLQTKQNIKGLDDEDLEKVTKKAMTLADTWEADVNEVTRAGQNLMKNFGLESEKSFDLMAYGAQNGLNFSNEMFDNLSEYAPLFSKMGFSADEYFQLLTKGSKAGVYNLDYINDAMKEFQIRVKDGSKGTSDAMGEMSKSTQKVWKDFLKGKGTVKDVHNAVLKELKGMDNQTKANQIGVGLYGR